MTLYPLFKGKICLIQQIRYLCLLLFNIFSALFVCRLIHYPNDKNLSENFSADMEFGKMGDTWQPSANAVLTPDSTQLRLRTGKVPGIAASKSETWDQCYIWSKFSMSWFQQNLDCHFQNLHCNFQNFHVIAIFNVQITLFTVKIWCKIR
jgi:hypothetical protein